MTEHKVMYGNDVVTVCKSKEKAEGVKRELETEGGLPSKNLSVEEGDE